MLEGEDFSVERAEASAGVISIIVSMPTVGRIDFVT